MPLDLIALLVDEYRNEADSTRKVLAAIDESKLDEKPHDKNLTTRQIAGHIADTPSWGTMILQTDEFNLDPSMENPTPESKDAIIDLYDKNVEEFLKVLAATNLDVLAGNWKMTVDGNPVVDGTRYDAIRTWVYNHMFHHRAHLTLFIRLMGGKMPGCYGPSADEMPPAAG